MTSAATGNTSILWTYRMNLYGIPLEFHTNPHITVDREISESLLVAYVDEGKPGTPTVKNRFSGAFGALATAIGFTVLRPFAALAALCISTNLDSKKQPLLAKIGRHLEVPRIYSKLAFERLRGYVQGGGKGAAKVIIAQVREASMWTIISSSHYRNYRHLMLQVTNSNRRVLTDEENEERRLGSLRWSRGEDMPLPNFGQLIARGYLVPAKKGL